MRKKYDIALIISNTINYIMLTLIFLLCIFPFYYVLMYSLSDPLQAQKVICLFPVGFTLDNYIRVIKLKGILNATFVSLLRTVTGMSLTVILSSFFAYLITKESLLFRKLIYRLLVVTMYLNAGLIPWYLTMKFLSLNNNFLLYILPTVITAFFVVLVKTFIEQLPPALEESAKIDGAGYLTIFARIIFPLSKPILATVAVFAAVNQWNTWIDNYFLVDNPKLMTLQLILYNYLNEANRISQTSISEMVSSDVTKKITPESVKMTITMVVTLPVLFVYPFMQRYFVKGIMLGAIKG